MISIWAIGFEMRGWEEGFWHGAFEGMFHLITIGLIAFFVNVFYQRFRDQFTARSQLMEDLDRFTVLLYKPRKMYQRLFDQKSPPPGFLDAGQWEVWRTQQIELLLSELVTAIGQFRALQVRIVPLFGHDQNIFAYYLAIWRYLKEIRQRVERRESLYFHHETPQSVDAFYRLIDGFRYRLVVSKAHPQRSGPVRPPHEQLQQMRERGDEVYRQYFEFQRQSESGPNKGTEPGISFSPLPSQPARTGTGGSPTDL